MYGGRLLYPEYPATPRHLAKTQPCASLSGSYGWESHPSVTRRKQRVQMTQESSHLRRVAGVHFSDTHCPFASDLTKATTLLQGDHRIDGWADTNNTNATDHSHKSFTDSVRVQIQPTLDDLTRCSVEPSCTYCRRHHRLQRMRWELTARNAQPWRTRVRHRNPESLRTPSHSTLQYPRHHRDPRPASCAAHDTTPHEISGTASVRKPEHTRTSEPQKTQVPQYAEFVLPLRR